MNEPPMHASAPALEEALQHHFGFSSFRPLQREIIESVLAQRDTLALLPTGGGKSLCYQIPALLQPGLTLVVSPLIALMKDQVDALQANGIGATFLNSSIDGETAAARIADIDAGKVRILYVAPERLVLSGFLAQLSRWQLNLIAVDEAHCVSEWGHDFRPEYRRIGDLRRRFPDVPLLALTATATHRVRGDIERFLALREPQRFVGSFNRPNLRYTVMPKRDGFAQLLAWCSERAHESGIVYAQSRRSAEELAERLSAAGISAKPYHAGLTPRERARNQELFIRDGIRVICATIAFGMGIDKPNVRYVVHYDLPKTIEGYYQESGRAGRDGLPSDCALFFTGGDAAKQRHFIRQIEDETERANAEQLLQSMLEFASTTRCRRAHLLRYFGEREIAESCGNCDACLEPREQIDATTEAQKILSCIYRICAAGFATGEEHIVDVLMGKETPKVERFGHARLSTFGIGTEHDKSTWRHFVSELLLGGFIDRDAERRTLTLTAEGMRLLKERSAFRCSKPTAIEKRSRRRRAAAEFDTPVSTDLFEHLRTLRKRIADEQGVPPYVVFSDATLREFAAHQPTSLAAFREISGVGDVKLERYGDIFVEAIRANCSP